MKTLVTGGAGFIGTHVVRALLERGEEVVVLDSFVTGMRSSVPDGVTVIEGDIRDRDAVARALEGVGQVVHLAALVSVPLSIEEPGLTEAVNVDGTRIVFEAASAAGVKRIVYASSAAVYGNEPSVPKREGSPLLPESPYASSKLENERIASVSPVSSMGLRFFNVYGPGQAGSHPYASVVPRWIEAVRAGTPIMLYGDGEQTRDFVHVRDVAAAVCAALSSSAPGVANIASGTEISLNELISLISLQAGDSVAVTRCPARPGDIMRSVADISRARDELGYEATVSLPDGISELLS